MYTRTISCLFLAVFFILFLGFTPQATSQSLWFQPGTEWSHFMNSQFVNGFIVTKLEKDTVINNTPCKQFSKTLYTFPSFSFIGESYNQGESPEPYTPLLGIEPVASQPYLYMYATPDDNEVYFLEDGVFIKMYDFDAPVGEILTLPYPSNILGLGQTLCPNRDFVISATGSDVIDGVTLKWIELDPTPETGYSHFGRIYQKMGALSGSFYPLIEDNNPNDMCSSIPSDFNLEGDFLCFKDDTFAQPMIQSHDACHPFYSCREFLEINPPFFVPGQPITTDEIPGGVYEASINIQSTAVVSSNTIFKANSSICLDPGFTVNQGATFEANIEPCSLEE